MCSCGHSRKRHPKVVEEAPADAELDVQAQIAATRARAVQERRTGKAPSLPFAIASQARNTQVRTPGSYDVAYTEAKAGLKSTSQSGQYEKNPGKGKGRARGTTKAAQSSSTQPRGKSAARNAPAAKPSTSGGLKAKKVHISARTYLSCTDMKF